MKFNSTIYLLYTLREKLNFDEKLAENCLRILNGFVIRPNSIEYDRESDTLLFEVSLPNSKFIPTSALINRNRGLSIYGKIGNHPEISLFLNFSVHTFSTKSVMILEDGTRTSGIYYYSTNRSKGRQKITYSSYYDSFTLKEIRFLSKRDHLSLDDLISNTPSTINNLGFMPDCEFTRKDETPDDIVYASHINTTIRNLDYTDITTRIAHLKSDEKDENEPITI